MNSQSDIIACFSMEIALAPVMPPYIERLLDLTWGATDQISRGLFLVAPDDRETEVR